MLFMLMISHEREPRLIIGVAALHHHAHNSCIVTHDIYCKRHYFLSLCHM